MKKSFFLIPFLGWALPFYCSAEPRLDTTLDVRVRMVREQIEARGVRDKKTLSAMRRVPRRGFVPSSLQGSAYEDTPLPIGHDQTISQPYIVALMTELLELKGSEKVLEIGTGSGYQAAVLAEIAKSVYTIEIVEPLAREAALRLKRLGHKNIFVRAGDGYKGWPTAAPFNGIIVTCAPDHIPQPLLDQLTVGGRLVIPVGDYPNQTLYQVRKTSRGLEKKEIIPVRFVPMTGEAQKER